MCVSYMVLHLPKLDLKQSFRALKPEVFTVRDVLRQLILAFSISMEVSCTDRPVSPAKAHSKQLELRRLSGGAAKKLLLCPFLQRRSFHRLTTPCNPRLSSTTRILQVVKPLRLPIRRLLVSCPRHHLRAAPLQSIVQSIVWERAPDRQLSVAASLFTSHSGSGK